MPHRFQDPFLSALLSPLLVACAFKSEGRSRPPCGSADPSTGEAPVCGEDQVCVCRSVPPRCATPHSGCATEYRFADGDGLCLSPADRSTVVPATPIDHPACPAGADGDAEAGGDADAGGDDGTDAWVDHDDDYVDGDGEESGDAPATFELAVFSGEELYATPVDRRQVTRDCPFPLRQSYSEILLECRLRTGCPSLCEASPRTLGVLMRLPDGSTVELLRAMTPFGANRTYVEDVTDLAAWFVDSRPVTVFIDTREGAWEVDVRFVFTKGTAPREVISIQPLVYEGEVTSASRIPSAFVTVPFEATRVVFRYRASGHDRDGWSCDETCRRRSVIAVDGTERIQYEPWRTDCAGFVDANPGTDPVLVGMTRSGWCPGDLVHPEALEATAWLTPGDHAVDLRIEGIAADRAYWRVALDLVVYR